MKKYAIVVAAGTGSRMGSDIPKQYMDINGKPLLYYTLKAFENADIDGVSLVVSKEYMQYALSEIVDKYNFKKIIRVCEGGAERFNSVFHALDDLADVASREDIVLVQDGARPFVTSELIDAISSGVIEYGAALAGVLVKDTIKISDPAGYVSSTTNRALTWQIQTPQGFRYGELVEAYRKVIGGIGLENNAKEANGTPVITDDSMIYETAFPEKKIKLIMGSYNNIKITTFEDLEVAKAKLF